MHDRSGAYSRSGKYDNYGVEMDTEAPCALPREPDATVSTWRRRGGVSIASGNHRPSYIYCHVLMLLY